MSNPRLELIRAALVEHLNPHEVEIVDESHRHAGHAGARQGGHFAIRIVADAFVGKSLVERHRMVYAALGDLMQGEIHALSIDARPPT